MKISKETVDVLKNFTSINQSIKFSEGDILRTMSPQKTIIGKATVKDSFDRSFCIHDLNQFLSVLNMFEEPEIDFEENYCVIRNEKSKFKTNYYFTSEEMIKPLPPEKDLKLPDSFCNFSISEKQMKSIMSACSVMQLPEVTVYGNGNNMRIVCRDSEKKGTNTFELDLGENDKIFNVVWKVSNLKMISGDYDVSISEKMLSHFVGKDVEYWVAIEAKHSSFGE